MGHLPMLYSYFIHKNVQSEDDDNGYECKILEEN